MICAEKCAIFLPHQYTDDNDDDLCEGRGNCRLSAEPRVVDIPRPEQRLIIIVFAFIVIIIVFALIFIISRPAQLARLPRSKLDPELFPHSAYVKIFVTFATKMPYLTLCDKM